MMMVVCMSRRSLEGEKFRFVQITREVFIFDPQQHLPIFGRIKFHIMWRFIFYLINFQISKDENVFKNLASSKI